MNGDKLPGLIRIATTFFVLAAAASAQQYEIGAIVGYGFYHNGTIISSPGNAEAGIRNRFAAGILLGDDFSRYVSVEFDYLYHDGHPFLQAGGAMSYIQGQSQTLTPELLFHFRARGSRWRPFLEGGAGAKGYIIAGPEPYPQLFPQIATLTTNDIWKIVFSAGGGVKFSPIRHMQLRVEFLDYMTTFPRQQIVPAPHNTARGIFGQFTPLAGIGYTF